jgi:hypothetical protein
MSFVLSWFAAEQLFDAATQMLDLSPMMSVAFRLC